VQSFFFRADGESSARQAAVRNGWFTASITSTCKLLYVFYLIVIYGKLLQPISLWFYFGRHIVTCFSQVECN